MPHLHVKDLVRLPYDKKYDFCYMYLYKGATPSLFEDFYNGHVYKSAFGNNAA